RDAVARAAVLAALVQDREELFHLRGREEAVADRELREPLLLLVDDRLDRHRPPILPRGRVFGNRGSARSVERRLLLLLRALGLLLEERRELRVRLAERALRRAELVFRGVEVRRVEAPAAHLHELHEVRRPLRLV